MKVGFLTAILNDRPLEEVLDLAKETGYDAVEIAAWPWSRHISPREAAEGKAEEILYEHISSWLKEAETIAWSSSKDNIMERIVEEDSIVYRQATQEALAFVTWLKRFAQARLKGGSP